jgi:non-heme chloroperoxidase
MNALSTKKEITLDYVTQGRRHGVPVVLLHGFTDSRRSFDRALARMPGSIFAVAISQRGHGDSDRPEDGYAVSDFSADVAAVLDELDLENAIIVGHCMGATVAQRFALDYPERTRRLALAGSFFTIANHAGVLEFWETVAKLTDPVDPEIVRDFQMSTIKRAVPESFLEIVIRESLKLPARVWKKTLRALLDTDFTAELGKIRVPTMLLWGERDDFAGREEQDRLLDAIPGSRLKIYTGIGHSPHWEDPTEFVMDLIDFAAA